MQNDVILKARHISKAFPGVQALSDVRLDVRKGSVHALCGENGAGKSTLLKIITGIYSKDSGEIYLDDKPINIKSIADARKLGIHVVPQEIQMCEGLTVAENIFLGRQTLKKTGTIDWKRMYEQAKIVRDKLGAGVVEFDVRDMVETLSMGQWQMIEIMRAMIDDNLRVIAFDEPTSSLSQEETERLFELINEMKANGVAVIYVSHKLSELFSICDEATVFKDGCFVGTRNIAEITADDVIQMMTGRELDIFGEPKDRSTIGENVLRVDGLSLEGKYKDISFQLKKGEILGFYGLVGAGRTEVMRGLFGVDARDAGSVFIDNKEVAINTPGDAKGHNLGFVTEDRRAEGLMLDVSLKWNISLPNLGAVCNRAKLLDRNKETTYAKDGMRLFTVKAPDENVEASGLSGGNQQKVIIAKWVQADCDILIFDEPTRGIDVGAKMEVYATLKALASAGKAIIMVSSELPEILGVSDRVIVMNNGTIVADLDNDNLDEEQILKYAIALKD